MEFVALSEAQRHQFDNEGYLILPQVLDRNTIDALISAGDQLIASDRQEKRQRSAGGLFDSFRNCVALDDAFIQLLAHPKVLPLVVQLMGPNLQLTTSHLIYRFPDPPNTEAVRRIPSWHRDFANTVEDLGHAHVPRMQVKCAYYLTDASTPNSGATLVLPGSHLLKDPPAIPSDNGDPLGALEPSLQPGDCMIFEQRLWHSGGSNLAGQIRKAVMFGYGYRWLKPADYLKQPPELLEKLAPLERFLMGEPYRPKRRFQVGGGANPLKEWCTEHGLTYTPPA